MLVNRTLTRVGAVLAAGATGLAAIALTSPTAGADDNKPKNAKNIILLIGDGMGYTHVTAARERFYGAAGMLNLQQADATGQVSTYAVRPDSTLPDLVTDSASAATAWSSGIKTYNAAIGVDAFGKVVPTLMEQAKAAGMRTGNVSTAEITDATPAGMFSHALRRGCQGPTYSAKACNPDNKPTPDPVVVTPIAEQIARNGTADVIFGGGLARFEPADEQAMKAQGYQVLGSFGDPAVGTDNGQQTAATQRIATRADLEAANAAKVIGLFNRGNLTVEKSKAEAPADAAIRQEPSLPEYTAKAIQLLSAGQSDGQSDGQRDGQSDGQSDGNGNNKAGAGKGFLLQVEGALIDKRSHANDAAQTLLEVKAFDDAVKVAKDFAAKDGNTLVITTADHECAGFNIIGKGSFTNAEAAAPPGNVDSSNPANNSTPRREFAANKKDPARSTGPVNGAGSADPKNFAPATFRTADDQAGVQDGSLDASLWLSYLSGNHTGADVPIYAVGPQSSRFLGPQDNTDIYRAMFGALSALGNERAPR